ncbi:acyltransferase family protein [Candidatus Protochlamydia sp. R18]|uniref:acyltransferase family protein n=1 Tax=Candidatus Protochlamydia sp. R18 TaxID=1353977 RepID=UPI0005A7B1D9|nr:acyltransferase [Candidatus Protochlamydia sp. R18]
MTQGSDRFQFLDGLRGIAALWVVLLHFHTLINERSTNQFSWVLNQILPHGHIGVNIFFVLSGFVIAYSIRQNIITFPFIARFFIRRSIRLDPPYWAALLILTGLILAGPFFFQRGIEYVPSYQHLFLNAFYIHNFFELKSILPVAWTLALEFQFYFVFVFLLKSVQSLNIQMNHSEFNYSTKYATGLFWFLFILSLMQMSHIGLFFELPGFFLPFWYSFFIGSLLCWAMLSLVSEFQLFLFFTAMLLFYVIGKNEDILITSAVALSIQLCIKKNKLHSYLSSYPFQYLGKISYSLYLTHWCVGTKLISLISYALNTGINEIPASILLIMGTLPSLAVAHIFYHYIEQPCLHWSRKIKFETIFLPQNFRATKEKQGP